MFLEIEPHHPLWLFVSSLSLMDGGTIYHGRFAECYGQEVSRDYLIVMNLMCDLRARAVRQKDHESRQ